MQESFIKLFECIEKCLLSKLSKEYYDNEFHVEYQLRNNALQDSFEKLQFLLESVDFTHQSNSASSLLSNLLILYYELDCKAPWNTEQIQKKEYSRKIDSFFINKHNVKVEEIMQTELFNCQVIFDTCIQELHKKLTVKDFKKYPGLIEAYFLLIKNIKNYKIQINPMTVLPVALLLMDDFNNVNKIKGLQSCKAVLQSITSEHFAFGNFYEIVCRSLEKNMMEKDRGVTTALYQCFLEFLKRIPADVKQHKLDYVFSSIVEDLNTESNLYRKADCFDFLTKVIEMHGINCVKKKLFKDVICENIDICSNEGVSEILLLHVLECYEMWLRHCWCVWRLCEDHKKLSSLLKVLYISREETMKLRIQNLIITLVKLCSPEEQADILDNLDDPLKCADEDFIVRLNTIKKEING